MVEETWGLPPGALIILEKSPAAASPFGTRTLPIAGKILRIRSMDYLPKKSITWPAGNPVARASAWNFLMTATHTTT